MSLRWHYPNQVDGRNRISSQPVTAPVLYVIILTFSIINCILKFVKPFVCNVTDNRLLIDKHFVFVIICILKICGLLSIDIIFAVC